MHEPRLIVPVTLMDIRGCLRHTATPNNSAWRRHSADDDSWLLPLAPPFELDLDKLHGAKAPRRLGNKTQVVTGNLNPHLRNRLIHSLEVTQVASIVARILGLNVRLAEAIAFGHDIGHTPFGHLGERVLAELTGRHFRHNVYGVVIAQHIEREGQGLNLTHHTLEGILHHSRGMKALAVSEHLFQEAAVAMCADKIAYIWADFNDIFMRSLLPIQNYPELADCARWFGATQRDRIKRSIEGLCHESAAEGAVSFTKSETAQRFARVKELMYTVYNLVNYECFHGTKPLEVIYRRLEQSVPGVDPAIAFALLSDHEALHIANASRWSEHDVASLSLYEMLPHLQGRTIDFTNPDLDW